MKIAFICSEKYRKYDKLISNIIDELKKDNENKEKTFDVNIIKNTRKKYDVYIVLSDDIQDFDENVEYTKRKPLLITSNLKSEYISHVITKVSDIVYSKNNMTTILKRINENLKRLNE